MTFESVEHAAILIGVVATVFGLTRAVRAWRAERRSANIARVLQEDLLRRVLDQFREDSGSSLLDRVVELTRQVQEHHAASDRRVAEHGIAHDEIQRRIDGLFELLGGNNAPRRIATTHHARKEDDR